MKIKTESGFSCQLSDDVLDDWDILVSFREIDKGDATAIIDVAPKLLGNEQYEQLKEHVIKTHGRLKASAMTQEIADILKASGQTKNS